MTYQFKNECIQAEVAQLYNYLCWRSGFDLNVVTRDPEFDSCCRNALQGQRKDLSSQEASLILYKYKYSSSVGKVLYSRF